MNAAALGVVEDAGLGEGRGVDGQGFDAGIAAAG